MSNNCYGVCFTPQTYNSYINWWNELLSKDNSYIIMDNTSNANLDINAFIYNENDIRNNFAFNHNVTQHHYWNSHGNRNIIWFYPQLRMMNFYINHKQYDYYWFFDDDVYCNDWDGFLTSFDNDDSDFLSYFLFKNTNVDSYPNIPKVDNKMFSGELWFRRFPGHTDTLEQTNNQYFGSFFPIVRFSKRSMEKLIELTMNGFFGYGEGFVPTSLANHGYKMNTIFLPDNTSNYFDINKIDIKHKNIKINWEWL